ncbi:MAG: ABC transporter substrate-binding protein, partial [Rhizobiaceae bacterium]
MSTRRFIPLVLSMLGIAAAAGLASAEPVIGVAAPLTGPMAVIGQQLADGARHAAIRGTVPIEIVDDACTPEGGKAAAETFLARKVAIVIGFACVEAVEAALPLLSASSIPVISPVIRAAHLTDGRKKSGHLFFRLAPRGDDEAAAMASMMKSRWTDRHFAILDDGTLASRDFAESFRLRMEEAGLKPALVESYRPAIANQVGLVRRVARAGATHVLVSGDRDDVAVIAR